MKLNKIFYGASIASILLIVSVVLWIKQDKPLKEEVFYCEGMVNTMFAKIPLVMKIQDDVLEWSWDLSIFQESMGKLISIPSIKKRYKMNIQYSDGVYIERIDDNTISVDHYHIKGTFFQDTCNLEYPIEIDSVKSLFSIRPFF